MTFTTFFTCLYHQHANEIARHMTFTTIFTWVYHLNANTFCPILHKNITNFWNVTTPHNFAISKIWGHTNHKTSTIHRHPKQLKSTETFLFNLLPQNVLTDIYIWVSGLKHCNKFKAVITNMNTMCNTTLLEIPQEIWMTYHNFSIYSSWYNEGLYKWAHRCIPNNKCLRYHLFVSYSMVISKLTQQHIELHKAVVACHHITWDKESSIPYFKQTILDSYVVNHATRDTHNLPGWWPRWTCCHGKSGICYLFYFIIAIKKILISKFLRLPLVKSSRIHPQEI